MPEHDVATDVALAVELVTQAGRTAERMRRRGVSVGRTANHADVVTAADLAAERIILDTLRERRPDDSILGAEGASHEGTSGRTWIIDPVDGTYNFLHGLDRWCSAIALLDGDEPVLGAVRKPRARATYVGGPALGLTHNGRAVAPLVDVSLGETCLATYLHPPAFGTPVGDAWQRAIAGAATIRMLGSGSLDLVSVARGQLGAYVQHSVPPWDWWPGVALVRAAGGHAERVVAGGVEWSIAGAPTTVRQIRNALLSVAE